MLFRLFKKINVGAGLFNGHFIDVKVFYALEFNQVPCITFIGDVNITKVFAFVKETCKADIVSTYQHSYFNHDDKKVYFNNTIIVLSFERMIEITGDYCQVLHAANQYDWARKLVNDLSQFRMETYVAPVFKPIQIVGFAKYAEMN